MVKKYTDTFADGARILAVIEQDCLELGLPWDSIFGSMGDENSPMRKAAIAAWNAILFSNRTLLTQGQIAYEARKPVVPMNFLRVAIWCDKNGEVPMSLSQIVRTPGLHEELLAVFGKNCRVVDLTRLQGDRFHIASLRDLMASRHIQANENFGSNDVIVIRLDPPGCSIRPTDLGTDELPVFEVVADVTFEKLHYHLRQCGCGLASDSAFLDADYSLPEDVNVFVRGDLMFTKYSKYSGAKIHQGTGNSDDVIILAGGYVIGKRIPGETRRKP